MHSGLWIRFPPPKQTDEWGYVKPDLNWNKATLTIYGDAVTEFVCGGVPLRWAKSLYFSISLECNSLNIFDLCCLALVGSKTKGLWRGPDFYLLPLTVSPTPITRCMMFCACSTMMHSSLNPHSHSQTHTQTWRPPFILTVIIHGPCPRCIHVALHPSTDNCWLLIFFDSLFVITLFYNRLCIKEMHRGIVRDYIALNSDFSMRWYFFLNDYLVKNYVFVNHLQQITALKKENFNLKLRIYFMEERMQQKCDDSTEDIFKTVWYLL